MPPPRRGAFIVIEGLDRSGKSTQTTILNDRLAQFTRPVKPLKFPDRTTPIGALIDSYLRSASDMDDHTIHLLFSANRWELASTIRTLLEAGTTVVCDRYAFSGIAFSASKVAPGAGTVTSAVGTSSPRPVLGYEWCRAPDISLPAPDLTLFLDISPQKAAAERSGYGEERYEKLDTQIRVREVFARIGSEMAPGTWVTLDAGASRENVAEAVWQAVEPLVDGVEGEVRRLWESERNDK